ncbi:hypothetical protein JCM11641_005389 [Rhodosporidiobolus odoratus]
MAAPSPRSNLSNPAAVWASNNPFAPLPPSEVALTRSSGSVARRATAALLAEEERLRRKEEFERNEARIAQELESELEAADVESAVVKQEDPGRILPPGQTAQEGELAVVQQELADLQSRQAILQRYLTARGGQGRNVIKEEDVVDPELDEEEATVSVRVKVNPPSTWKGSYDRSVIEAVRAHWKDDQAADAALLAYRSARQGSLRARDFGAKMETLADACFDRTIDEADRISSFLTGLNGNYREFVKTQLATLKTMGRVPVTLGEHVDLAAAADGLDSYSSSLKVSVLVLAQDPEIRGNKASEKTARWHARAEEWQKAHPTASRGEWSRDGSQTPPQSMYCYQCGRFEQHYSAWCPNPRKDPKAVTIAAFRLPKLDADGLLPFPYSAPPAPGDDEAKVAGDASAGKVGGANSTSTSTLQDQDQDVVVVAGIKMKETVGSLSPRGPGDSGTARRSSFSSSPGDTVDKGNVLNVLDPGDTVDRSAGNMASQGDSFDLPIQSAALALGDSIERGVRPGDEEVGRTADGSGSGSCNAADSVSLVAAISKGPEGDSSCDSSTIASERKRKKRKAKHRNRRPKPKMAEPIVAAEPLTVTASLDSEVAVSLIDSGSQADIVSSEFALKHGFELRRLVAPVHADLGSDGHTVRLALYTSLPCAVGTVEQAARSFFVAPLPPGIDAILGVPWLRNSGMAVSAKALFFVPEGPSEEVYDFETGRFALQPERNFENLGFEKRPMTEQERTDFFLCALAAGVPGLEDYVDYEPRNPLLDYWDDDPSVPDLSEADANERLSELLGRFDDVFVDDLPDRLPPFRPINHDIVELVGGLRIPPCVIGMPDRYARQWSAHLLKFVETGYWSPRALESACSMFAVPKHDPSQARFVINLKPCNANTVRTASPIPDMKQVRSNFAAHPVRSKLDFKKAYEQIRLNLEFRGEVRVRDKERDFRLSSYAARAHLRYLEIIFSTLRHYKFYLAKDKVELMVSRMDALGAVVSDEGIEVDPGRWSAIQDWPVPKNPRDILRFMGVLQWMSDHLPHLNELAAPLTRLTGNVEWNWSPACDAAFEALKKLVPLKLAPLNLEKLESGEERLFLFTDASMVGSGGWIGQGVSREVARPFRFHSSKFNSAQLNYTTTDQELLAVLDCCLKFRDHLPPKQTRRHVRLWEKLSQFDFDWEFIPGKKNVLADSLSRLAELMQTEGSLSLREAQEPLPAADDDIPFPKEPSKRAMMAIASLVSTGALLPPGTSFLSAPLLANSSEQATVLTASLPSSFLAALPAALEEDTLAKKVLAAPSSFPGFAVNDGILYRQDDDGYRLVVPRTGTLPGDDGARGATFVEEVVRLAHDTVGHQGAAKTLGWARRSFWWSSMHKDVLDYCASCGPCSRGQSVPAKPYGLLHALDVPPRPWAWAGINFVVGLPPALYQGRLVDSILTATCPLSKMVVLMPLPSTASAEDVASTLFDHVYRRFGSQLALISDRDPKFISAFWRSLHKLAGVSLKMSSSAHPETDGRSEVTNKSVGTTLRILCADSPDDWASKVTTVEFALNSAPAAATSLSPFEVVYGFLPSAWPVDSWTSTGHAGADNRGERARLDWLRVTDAIISARVEMVHQGNKSRREDLSAFAVGAKVYVSTSGMRFSAGLSHKFIPKFVGPFPITASKLRPHFPNDSLRSPSRALTEPPPAIPATDGADVEWEVEKVVAVKEVRKKRVFRVRYLGYGEADDQWRPEAELQETAPDALKAFLERESALASTPVGGGQTGGSRYSWTPWPAGRAVLLSSESFGFVLKGGGC